MVIPILISPPDSSFTSKMVILSVLCNNNNNARPYHRAWTSYFLVLAKVSTDPSIFLFLSSFSSSPFPYSPMN